ncbi:DNA polymerase III subunit delta [Gallibacterium salpingitidis]|nr:DNA polymerase III subunit delta [Gallibacterium salpingitidis]WKS99138.1 DNA polymerase III subunit delta [Gallibacterium salpingitidis]
MMIRIFPNKLVHSLQQQSYLGYLLVGQDPLLLEETKATILQFAKQQGVEQKQDLIIDTTTDWSQLFNELQTFGLFSTKQIFFLTLPENLSTALQQQLQQLVSLLNEDVIVVLQMANLSLSTEKQAWFTHLNQLPILQINCQTPPAEQLPQWIKQRAATMSLELEPAAIELLAYNYENNLAALKQVLQLMQLLYPQQTITLLNANQCIEQASVFTPYQLVDAILQGKQYRAARILEQLQNEGDIQAVVLLRILQKELFLLLELGTEPAAKITQSQQMLATTGLKERFDQLRIWKNRRPFYTAALQRLSYHQLYHLIHLLTALEKTLKQNTDTNAWQALQEITITMAS